MNLMLVALLMFPAMGRFWDRPFFRNPVLAESLRLSEEQVQKLEDLYRTEAKQIRLRGELALTKLTLHRELQADQPDQSKVDRLIEEIGKIQVEMLRNRVERQLGVRQILTTEQLRYLQRHPFPRPRPHRRGGRG